MSVTGGRGMFLPNSQATDDLRRSVVKRLPVGAVERICGRLGCRDHRIYDEHDSKRIYSVDVFRADLDELTRFDRELMLDRFLWRWNLRTLRFEQRASDDSAAGAS